MGTFWDQFSQNIATDLAPFISLFGDAPTKQYLIESTNPEDIIVFAIAPAGIITSIVSVIRISGIQSLRAFIGRAHERKDDVEVDLRKSTSRNVAEMFTDGGIARVSGRAKILEVVHNTTASVESWEVEPAQASAGIHLARDFFNNKRLCEQSGWEEREPNQVWTNGEDVDLQIAGKDLEKQDLIRQPREQNVEESPEDTSTKRFAPHPNLSLNCRNNIRSRALFFVTLVLGLALQSGVLVWAAISQYIFHLQSNSDVGYAVPSTVIGTILVSLGVGLSLYLLEGHTGDRIFKRHESRASESQIYWIQPGNQNVGGQIFDAFAYTETKDQKLRKYVTSWRNDTLREKDAGDRFEMMAWLAILSTIVGFLLQTIGLRACHSSVSVAQLGVMIVMSFVRGKLRLERTSHGRVQIDRERYELDWLALWLGHDFEDQSYEPKWQPVYSGHHYSDEQSFAIEGNQISILRGDRCQISGTLPDEDESDEDCRCSAKIALKHESRTDAAAVFNRRVRLGHLTEDWEEDLVFVRQTARMLKQAMESTLKAVFTGGMELDPEVDHHWRKLHVIYFPIECMFSNQSKKSQSFKTKGQVNISARRQPDALDRSGGDWKVELSELEAVLGLWMWALIERKKDRKKGPKKPYMRVLGESVDLHALIRTKSEFGTWTGNQNPEILDSQEITTRPEEDFFANPTTGLRFGWQNVPSRGERRTPIRVLKAPTTASLEKLCAQEIYSLFLRAIILPIRDIGGRDVIYEKDGYAFVENTQISRLQDIIEKSGLGSRDDAATCIIPTLKLQGKLPSALHVAARDKSEKLASQLLRDEADPNVQDKDGKTPLLLAFENHDMTMAHLLLKMNARLYERDEAGETPLYAATTLDGMEVFTILLRRSSDLNFPNTNGDTPLHRAASSHIKDFAELLIEHEANVNCGSFDSPLHRAASSGRDEIVRLLIEKGADINKRRDEIRRGETPLFDAVSNGHESTAQLLLEMGADPNIPNASNETPLWLVACGQNINLAKLLLKNGADPNIPNDFGNTPIHNSIWGEMKVDRTRVLLEGGADPNHQNWKGETPLQKINQRYEPPWATEDWTEIISLLAAAIDPAV